MKSSFVVVVAATAVAGLAAVACGSDGDSNLNPSSLFPRPDDPTSSSSSSSGNPPPPPPVPPPAPDFGDQPTTLAKAPPALGQATVAVTADGHTAIASDPDRDRVLIVGLDTKTVKHEVALTADDVPGRLVIDDTAKKAHVVLHRAGAIASVDLETGAVTRTNVCGAPQGIGRDADADKLYVTCADGVINTIDKTGKVDKLAQIDRDLRDIVVLSDGLLVSRLRSAEVLRVTKDGKVASRAKPSIAGTPNGSPGQRDASVAWRLIASGNASTPGATMIHQAASTELIDAEKPQSYVGLHPCGGTIGTMLTSFTAPGATTSANAPTIATSGAFWGDAVTPTDIALSPDGKHYVVIAAGNGHTKELPQVQYGTSDEANAAGTCNIQPSSQQSFGGARPQNVTDPGGQIVAAAFTPDSTKVVVFSREPAALHIKSAAQLRQAGPWESIMLGGDSREDTGHAIFHSNTGGRVACVSCHPGGGDDGRVWGLPAGNRRTQSLEGTLEGTAPYHWGGDAQGIETFATDVFTKKMGGNELPSGQVDTLKAWVTRIPKPPVSKALDADALARGKTLFESTATECTTCHSGAKMTNNHSIDVGTDGLFQVPPLVGLGVRAPYLHDGRAETLRDTLTSDAHGKTSQLTTEQMADLIVYLDSL